MASRVVRASASMSSIRKSKPAHRPLPGAKTPRRGAVAVEAAVCLPVIVLLMLGMWDVGRVAQMSRLLEDAAREGARVAAGGTNNGSPVTVANVQSAVQNYLTAGGMPAAAINGATISVTNLSSDSWTNPGKCASAGSILRHGDDPLRAPLSEPAAHYRDDVRRHPVDANCPVAIVQRRAGNREHAIAVLGLRT